MGSIVKPFVAFVNDNISESIQTVLMQQLMLSEILSMEEFTLRIQNNPNYADIVRGLGQRIVVLKKMYDKSYNDVADIILFCRNGLIAVESSKIGPPGITFEIKNIQIFQLFFHQTQVPNTSDVVDFRYPTNSWHW